MSPPRKPKQELNLRSGKAVVQALHDGAEAHTSAACRRGGVDAVAAPGRLTVGGDLHDHADNLAKLIQLAELDDDPNHHLVIQEVIHGPKRVNGCDLSVQSLARVAALKAAYPEQVHVLQSNHELAQFLGEAIMKENVSVVEAFEDGIDYLYEAQAEAVRQAMAAFIGAMPLAVRCPNHVLCCHSLPSPRGLAKFDTAVLDRVPTEDDLAAGGSAHRMVWGRNHSQNLLDTLGQAWGVDLFVMGHQPAEAGYETVGGKGTSGPEGGGTSALILASDHPRGMALPIDLGRAYDLEEAVEALVPLAGVVLDDG